MLIDIHIKFREDILKGFQVKERTRFCEGQTSEGNNSKSINEGIMVRSCTFAYRLMLIDIHIKFREGSLNEFQVKERT